MRAPVEWHDIFLEWLETFSPELKNWYKDSFKELFFRLDGTCTAEGQPHPSIGMSWRKSSAQGLIHSGMLSLEVRKIRVSSVVISQGSS